MPKAEVVTVAPNWKLLLKAEVQDAKNFNKFLFAGEIFRPRADAESLGRQILINERVLIGAKMSQSKR